MVKIRWLKSAKNDLKSIYEFIALDSKKYARYQVLQLRNSTDILKNHPLIGKILKEYGTESIREIVIGQYRIIYRIVTKDLIHIILIHHGARKFPRLEE